MKDISELWVTEGTLNASCALPKRAKTTGPHSSVVLNKEAPFYFLFFMQHRTIDTKLYVLSLSFSFDNL